MKKFWYLNQKELGDLLKCREAYKAITLSLNNLGLHYRNSKQIQQSAKYFKQMLEIEEAIQIDIELVIVEMTNGGITPTREL
jgi:hypothetical protein